MNSLSSLVTIVMPHKRWRKKKSKPLDKNRKIESMNSHKHQARGAVGGEDTLKGRLLGFLSDSPPPSPLLPPPPPFLLTARKATTAQGSLGNESRCIIHRLNGMNFQHANETAPGSWIPGVCSRVFVRPRGGSPNAGRFIRVGSDPSSTLYSFI